MLKEKEDQENPHSLLQMISKEPGPGLLSLETCTRILGFAGIDLARWKSASNETELETAFNNLTPPLVMKIDSPDIVHKSDTGGVITGLEDIESVCRAYAKMIRSIKTKHLDAKIHGVTLHEFVDGVELVLGMSRDPQFGPVVMTGAGGVLVEIMQDLAFRVAPFDRKEGLAALEELRSNKMLDGYRGRPSVDRNKLADTMVSLGELALALPLIEEIDLNPVMASERGVIAADVRMVRGV